MARGPCGIKFMKAYDCYLDGENENKDNCAELYLEMKDCWESHPEYDYQGIIDKVYGDGPGSSKSADSKPDAPKNTEEKNSKTSNSNKKESTESEQRKHS